VRIGAQHARAIVSHDGPGLERASAAFEEIGASLRAAEAAADAVVAHRAAGHARAAAGAAVRARALAEQCEGARTPALVAVDEDPDVATLTRREDEVARLAAAGLSSKEVAERLFLSVRTVDNHLQRVYAKLGVSSRRELAHRLAE
jgi:DNA-binding CsgD family transcriptional regulator